VSAFLESVYVGYARQAIVNGRRWATLAYYADTEKAITEQSYVGCLVYLLEWWREP
jgi:hypothetical protein